MLRERNRSTVKVGGLHSYSVTISCVYTTATLACMINLLVNRYRHPNVVDLMGFVNTSEAIHMSALVFEYLPRGSLFHNLHKVS